MTDCVVTAPPPSRPLRLTLYKRGGRKSPDERRDLWQHHGGNRLRWIPNRGMIPYGAAVITSCVTGHGGEKGERLRVIEGGGTVLVTGHGRNFLHTLSHNCVGKNARKGSYRQDRTMRKTNPDHKIRRSIAGEEEARSDKTMGGSDEVWRENV